MSSHLRSVDDQYHAEFDCVNRDDWNEISRCFDDANLYQSWDYDAVRCGEEKLSHFVLKRDGETVAASQARIVKAPGLGFGAAYIRWGPLFRRSERPENLDAFRMALRALRNEYVCQRGLMLRVFPLGFTEQNESICSILEEELYAPTPGETPQRTFVLDISAPLPALRKGFKQKWRNCLNRAERNNLEVTEGKSEEMFTDFIGLYKAMVARKKFSEPSNVYEFMAIQDALPECSKMAIMLCMEEGSLTGGAICSAIGDTGLYLFGATNEQGMKNKASYLLQRHAIEWMQAQGCRYYNLNGVNQAKNPGGYHFKAGLAGTSGKEVSYLGCFDCHGGMVRKTIAHVGMRVLPLGKQFVGASRRLCIAARGN